MTPIDIKHSPPLRHGSTTRVCVQNVAVVIQSNNPICLIQTARSMSLCRAVLEFIANKPSTQLKFIKTR